MISIVSTWVCDCRCGCKKTEDGNVFLVGRDIEMEAQEPRTGWAELPGEVAMCPECWKNVGADHGTIPE